MVLGVGASESRMSMSTVSGDRSAAGSLSLEHLIALNDEIAALIRAGLPLERGLLSVGSDLPGRLGEVTRQVADGMGRGTTWACGTPRAVELPDCASWQIDR